MIYDDLENHFTTPKTLQIYSKSQRVPRKFKKKWKDILNHYSNLKLQQKSMIICILEIQIIIDF